MIYLFYATAAAILMAGFAPIRRPWPDYLAAALCAVDAVVLFLAHRVAPGVVLLVLGAAWLTLRLERDRKTGGAR